jgi:hypothetical protein
MCAVSAELQTRSYASEKSLQIPVKRVSSRNGAIAAAMDQIDPRVVAIPLQKGNTATLRTQVDGYEVRRLAQARRKHEAL